MVNAKKFIRILHSSIINIMIKRDYYQLNKNFALKINCDCLTKHDTKKY